MGIKENECRKIWQYFSKGIQSSTEIGVSSEAKIWQYVSINLSHYVKQKRLSLNKSLGRVGLS
jgi:hypothetical protein